MVTIKGVSYEIVVLGTGTEANCIKRSKFLEKTLNTDIENNHDSSDMEDNANSSQSEISIESSSSSSLDEVESENAPLDEIKKKSKLSRSDSLQSIAASLTVSRKNITYTTSQYQPEPSRLNSGNFLLDAYLSSTFLKICLIIYRN